MFCVSCTCACIATAALSGAHLAYLCSTAFINGLTCNSIVHHSVCCHRFSVVKSYCGHGIGSLFHCAPSIPHYAANKVHLSVQLVPESVLELCYHILVSSLIHHDGHLPDALPWQDGHHHKQYCFSVWLPFHISIGVFLHSVPQLDSH